VSRDSENHDTIAVMSSGYAANVRGFPEQARHSSNMGAEKQSRRMSLVEAVTNVVVGFGVALLTQVIIFPLFGLNVSLGENFAIGGLFTLASIARSYALSQGLRNYSSAYRPSADCRARAHMTMSLSARKVEFSRDKVAGS
jgi:hypothetical protein